jgi:hypothetical protein
MIKTGPKGYYAQKELLDDKYRPEGPMRSKEGPPRRANAFKSDRPEGPIRSKAIGPKGHYAQKELLDDKSNCRPQGPIC